MKIIDINKVTGIRNRKIIKENTTIKILFLYKIQKVAKLQNKVLESKINLKSKIID